MTEPTVRLTTAQALGAYRRELIDQGFSSDESLELVLSAAKTLVSDEGLGVKEELTNV